MAVGFPGEGGFWFSKEANGSALAKESASTADKISTSSRPICLLITSKYKNTIFLVNFFIIKNLYKKQ